MAIYHVVLFNVRDGTPATVLDELKRLAQNMVGQIPGLQRLDANPPLASTAHRTQGYNFGFVAILDKPETVQVYAEHPAHIKVHKLRESVAVETIVYDLEFEP